MRKSKTVFCIIILLTLILSSCSDNIYLFDEMMTSEVEYDYPLGGDILIKDLSDYCIVYEDQLDENELKAVETLNDAIYEKTGVKLDAYPASYQKNDKGIITKPYEIVIGNTLRKECNVFLSDYCQASYGYDVVNNKLLLMNKEIGTDLTSLIETFITNVVEPLKNEDKYFFRSEEDAYIVPGGMVETIILNGNPITDYEIIQIAEPDKSYYEESCSIAKLFKKRLGELCGYLLPLSDINEITEDGFKKKAQIYVGIQPTLDTLLNNLFEPAEGVEQYQMYADDSGIYCIGTSSYCVADSITVLLSKLTPATELDELVVDIVESSNPVYIDDQISIMRMNMKGQWPSVSHLEDYVYQSFPDLFVLENAEDSLGYSFEHDFSEYYSCVENGFGCNIYYCPGRFSVTDSGNVELPEDGEYLEQLRCYYTVLKDNMTFEEIVLLTSNLHDETVSTFEDVVDYLIFPQRTVIYLGEDFPENCAEDLLMADNNDLTDDFTVTMFTHNVHLKSYENISDKISEAQRDYAVIWREDCDAHIQVIDYMD